MHPEFSQQMIHEHQRDLDRRTRAAYYAPMLPQPVQERQETVVLRLCRVADDGALERLAQLEGQPAPAGRYVVAEVNGDLVAAMSLVSGAMLADPFRPTAELIPLLELRAAQIAPQAHRSHGLPLWSTVRGWGKASA
jgi:hypothetical protein